jgi:endonuclease G
MTNYLSNITPQAAALNQGPWEALESAERALARRAGVTAVYVMTGPLYEKEMKPLPGANEPHKVPSGYWKVVALEDARGLSTAAFIMHQDTKKTANFCNFVVPVRTVEERSHLNFFSGFGAQAVQDVFEAVPGTLKERLGCVVVQMPQGAAMARVAPK